MVKIVSYAPSNKRADSTQCLYAVNVRVFFAISKEKGSKNHRETLYPSKGKIVYVVGKACNTYRLQANPYDNYRISLQSVNITGFL